jgi:hypothetical protein
MYSRRNLLKSVATGASLTILAGAGVVLAAPRESLADPLLDVAWRGRFESCDYLCRECGTDKHDIVVAVENKHKSSHLENCNPGTCASHSCNAEEQSLVRDLWLAVRKGRADALPAAVTSSGLRVEYNGKRHSLQVRCERGELIANFPLSPQQVSALEEQ